MIDWWNSSEAINQLLLLFVGLLFLAHFGQEARISELEKRGKDV